MIRPKYYISRVIADSLEYDIRQEGVGKAAVASKNRSDMYLLAINSGFSKTKYHKRAKLAFILKHQGKIKHTSRTLYLITSEQTNKVFRMSVLSPTSVNCLNQHWLSCPGFSETSKQITISIIGEWSNRQTLFAIVFRLFSPQEEANQLIHVPGQTWSVVSG